MSKQKTKTEKPDDTTPLDEMASSIKAEHEAVIQASRTALEHARTAGELLSKAKEQVEETEYQWGKWVEKKCRIIERTANNYIRIHQRWDEIKAKVEAQDGDLARLTVRAALALLKTTTRTPKAQKERLTLAVIKERMTQHNIEGDPAELVALLKEMGLRVAVEVEEPVEV